MTQIVAGGLDDLKPHPAQGKGPVVGGNKVVGLVDHAGGLPLHRPRGEGEKVAFQGEERGAHPRLGKGEGNFCAILLLKIPVVGAVVHVGVGAKHPRRGQPVGAQGVLQLLPLLQQAGVQQNTPLLIQPVQGDQLTGLNDPGVSLDLCQVHVNTSRFASKASF